MDLENVRFRLKEAGVEGWLLYDFHGNNDLAREMLGNGSKHLTRRFFYWIPVVGNPIKIVHEIETGALEPLPGEKKFYLRWEELQKHLMELLKGKKKIAMEYSPNNAVPYVSKVDGGTLDLVRSSGVEVVSSASFLQYYTCVWNEEQLEMHLFAVDVLDKTAEGAWRMIAEALRAKKRITEYDVQQWILREVQRKGCEMEGAPICAVNAHSADPHYEPSKESACEIKKGDYILIDLWCKKRASGAVYADITRVGIAAGNATQRQQEIFKIVRTAQKRATELVKERFDKKQKIRGYEVDQVCRHIICDAGYGSFFTHRTGHNIHTEAHGPGANMDSLETKDERLILPSTCFSIEPGIYLPGEFGVRLEYDVYISQEGKVRITGSVQEQLKFLF